MKEWIEVHIKEWQKGKSEDNGGEFKGIRIEKLKKVRREGKKKEGWMDRATKGWKNDTTEE